MPALDQSRMLNEAFPIPDSRRSSIAAAGRSAPIIAVPGPQHHARNRPFSFMRGGIYIVCLRACVGTIGGGFGDKPDPQFSAIHADGLDEVALAGA
jgi:hypothetical protein